MRGLYESVLITGGRGMLAQAFMRVLAKCEIRPTMLGRQECDLANHQAVEQVLTKLRPTLVINCAAYTKVDQAEKDEATANAVNGLGVQNLSALCRRLDAALVHFSTDYVFNGALRRPLRPSDSVGPLSVYGKSKLLGEQGIQHDPPKRWLIVRTAWLYGAGGANFVDTMLNAALARKPLRVVRDQLGSPTYTMDLAEATLDLLDKDASGIFHLTNSGQTTWFDFAREIFEMWRLSPDLQPTTSAEWKASRPESAIRPAYSVLDTSDYTRLTNRTPRSWREALRDYHAAVRSS